MWDRTVGQVIPRKLGMTRLPGEAFGEKGGC
jgi:hypothetical protein